jgi:hypothetical protein
MPLLPLIIPSHVSETVLAKGVIAPNPVMQLDVYSMRFTVEKMKMGIGKLNF